MFRFAVTFSCWPHVAYTYGSNAPSMAQAYRDALQRARPTLATLGECHKVTIQDDLHGGVRTFGHDARWRRGSWDRVH